MTIKPWMTKGLALVVLVLAYVMHNNWIPPGYMLFGRVNLAGLVTDAIALLGMLGISGPQLSPTISAWLGNGPAKVVVAPVEPR